MNEGKSQGVGFKKVLHYSMVQTECKLSHGVGVKVLNHLMVQIES